MPEPRAGSATATSRTIVERKSDLELVVTRTFDAPARTVYQAWSDPGSFQRWWVPASAGLTLLSCAMDVRTGSSYRLVFRPPMSDQPIAFFGTYKEVTPNQRIVWTNEESDQGAVTTATFEEDAGRTRVAFDERYPTKAALKEALAGSAEGLPEQFAQLDGLLAGMS